MAYQFPLNGGRINASVGGNSTSAGAGYQLVSTGTLLLAGGNNVTLSQNGSAITISGANIPAQTAYSFANGGGVSFGTNGSTVTATVATNYSPLNHNHGIPTLNLTNLSGTTNSASNGLTLSLSAAAQSNQNLSLYALGNTTQNSSTLLNASNLSFNGLGGATVGFSNGSIQISGAAGGGGGGIALANSQTTYSTGTAQVLEGAGAITIGSTTGQRFNISVPQASSISATGAVSISTNGNTISIGAPNQSVQTQGLQTVNLGGNTAGAMASISSGALSLYGGDNITLSQNANSVTISGGAGGGGGGGVALSAAGGSITSGTASIVGGGALTASVNGQTLSLNAPVTSLLSAAGGISISTNGSTVIFSGATGGGGAPTYTATRWEYPNQGYAPLGAVVSNSMSVQRIQLPFALSASAMRLGVSLNATSFTSATTQNFGLTGHVGIYSLNASTLSLITSNSVSYSSSFSTNQNTGLIGPKEVSMPFSLSLPPGDYWVGAIMRSSSAYNTGFTVSVMGNSLLNASGILGVIGGNSTSGKDVLLGQGLVATASIPSSLNLTGVSNNTANQMQRAAFYHAFYNATY